MGIADAVRLQRVQEQVSFYRNCFGVCMAGMLIFFCLAVFLCIYYKIPSILTERLGIKRKRTLSGMEKAVSLRLSSGRQRERKDYSKSYEEPDATMETSLEKTVLLTGEAFLMEKDIVLPKAENRQRSEET